MLEKEFGMKSQPRAPSRQPSDNCKFTQQLSVSATGNSDSTWNTTVATKDEDIKVSPCASGLDRQVTGSTQDVSVDSSSSSVSSTSHNEGKAMFNRLKNHRATYNPVYSTAADEDKDDGDEDHRNLLRLSNLSTHIQLSEGSSRNRKVDSLLMSPKRHDSPSVSSASSASTGPARHRQRRARRRRRCSKNAHQNSKDNATAQGFDQVIKASCPDSFVENQRRDLHLDTSHGTITTCPSTYFASPITPRLVLPPISSGSSDEEKNIQEEAELVEALAKWEDSIELTEYDPCNEDDHDNDSISSLEVSLAGSDDEDDMSSRRRRLFHSEHVNDSTVTNFDIDFLDDEDDYGFMKDDEAADMAFQRFQAATHHVVRGGITSTKNCDTKGGTTSTCSIGEDQEDKVSSKAILHVSLTRRDSLPRLPSSSLEVKESRWMADSSHGATSSISCSTRTSASGCGSVDVPPTPPPKRGVSDGVLMSSMKQTIDWKLCFPSPIISSKDLPPPSPRRCSIGAGYSHNDDLVEKSQKSPILPPGSLSNTAKPVVVPSMMIPRCWSTKSNSLQPQDLIEKAIRTAKQCEVTKDDNRFESALFGEQQQRRNNNNGVGRRWSCM